MTEPRDAHAGGRETAPRLLRGRRLRGYNVHHRTSVFSQRLHPGALSGLRMSDLGPELARRFTERFGRLEWPVPEGRHPGISPTALSLTPDALLTDALLEAILAVERFVASGLGRLDPPRFARVVYREDEAELVWESQAGWVSRGAARAGFAGLIELLPDAVSGGVRPAPGFAEAIARLRRRARRREWSPATAALALAAKQRGLTHELLAGNYVRVGEGVSQQMISGAALGLVGRDRSAAAAGAIVAGAILDQMFPAGVPASVPVALVIGERGTRWVARSLDLLLRTQVEGVGLATRGQATIQGRPIDRTSLGWKSGAKFLLRDPRVAMVVSAASPKHIVERGFGLDRSTVTALLDPGPASDLDLYRAGIDVGLAATTGAVVIGADSPFAGFILASLAPERVVVAARRAEHPRVARHLAAGGSAVLLCSGRDGKSIELRRGASTMASLPISSTAAQARLSTRRGLKALYTVGLAFGLGLEASTARNWLLSLRPVIRTAERPDTRGALRLAESSP